MYNNLDELFELKKAKIQYDFDSKNYAGVYYPGIHELEVNVNKITYPQAVISYIHESLHYIAHEKDLGVFQFDYLILYLELTYFSSIYKYNIISDYLTNKNIIDEEEKRKYIFVNSLEIDECLATDKRYVDYLKFCIDIYDIYLFTVVNSMILNESIATFVSLNVNSDYYIYNVLNLKDFFYDSSVDVEIKKEQSIHKQKIKKLKEKNIYSIAYKHIEKLVDKYGVETTLVLAQFILNYIPVYNFDLIGCGFDERQNILNKYFNLDKTWLNLTNLKDSDIFVDSSYKSFKKNAPLVIVGYSIDQLPIVDIKSDSILKFIFESKSQLDIVPESVFDAYKRIYFHPNVISAIENLNGSKPNIFEMIQALEFAEHLINDVKFQKLYDFIDEKEAEISDYRIKKFPQLLQKPSRIYVHKLIQQMVSTMDTIISINKHNKE